MSTKGLHETDRKKHKWQFRGEKIQSGWLRQFETHQVDSKYSVHHGEKSNIVCFKCNRARHVKAKCTTGNRAQEEYSNANPQRTQNWQQ